MFRLFSIFATAAMLLVNAHIGFAQTDTLSTDRSETEDQGVSATKTTHVIRAAFTNGIQSREPIDQIDSLTTQFNNIFFFCEIAGMEGRSVSHRWIYDQEKVAEVSFEIGGARWRVYSSKTLLPEWTGTWKVEIADEEGNKLDERSFVYGKAE